MWSYSGGVCVPRGGKSTIRPLGLSSNRRTKGDGKEIIHTQDLLVIFMTRISKGGGDLEGASSVIYTPRVGESIRGGWGEGGQVLWIFPRVSCSSR